MKFLSSKTAKVALGFGGSVAAGLSQAAIDTAPIVSSLTDAAAAVAVVGAAVLGVVVVMKSFKYIRGAF